MTYAMFGEALLPNFSRECGHPFLQAAEECELCDVDWLLETGNAADEDAERLRDLRPDVVAELTEALQRTLITVLDEVGHEGHLRLMHVQGFTPPEKGAPSLYTVAGALSRGDLFTMDRLLAERLDHG